MARKKTPHHLRGMRQYEVARALVHGWMEAEELPKRKEPVDREEAIRRLGHRFLDAAERANVSELQAFLDEGFPVNWQEPRTGQTALHIVAAYQARRALLALLASDELNFLVRDHQGRLASEMAYIYGNDVAMARLLENKERKQAEAQGITLTRRP